MNLDSVQTVGGITVNRRRLLVSAATAAGALLGACNPAAPTAPPTSAPAKPVAAPTPAAASKPTAAAGPTSAPAAKPTAATKAPASNAPKIKLSIAQVNPVWSFAPLYLAVQAGYFDDEGVDMNVQIVSSGALASAALVSGEVQAVAGASTDNLTSYERQIETIVIAGYVTSLMMDLAASNSFLQKTGLTRESPLKDRVTALKGTKLGVSSVAGAPTQFAKYLLKAYGLNPETDAEYIVVGSGPTKVAALRQEQVDVFIAGQPDAQTAERQGIGKVYVVMGQEIPIFKDFVYETLTVTKDWVAKNPEPAQRIARALGRANNHIQNDFDDSKRILKSVLPGAVPEIVDQVMAENRGAFAMDARMTESGWKNAVEVHLASGAIKTNVPTQEGVIWTNKYLVDVPKR